jgi:ABC-type sugar transport system substrate-binding protein
VLGACTPTTPTEEMATTEEQMEEEQTIAAEDIKIGYIVKTLGNTFWQTYEQGARAAAADLGVQIDVRDVPTEGDIKGQLDVAMAMVGQDYDAIVAASITNTNLIPAIAEANKNNIPWIVVSEAQDENVLAQNDAYVTAQVRLSFYEEGVIIGEYVAEQLNGEGQVGIVEGMAGTSATRDRIQGVMDVFKDYPDIEVVASQPADWQRELARDVAGTMLQANPDIDAIIANNDTMALGVAVAVEQAGKKGEIIVTGDDGTPEAYEAIKNGDLAATVDGVAWQIAYYSVHAAVKAVVEGAKTLPNYDLKPNLVTIVNVEEVAAQMPKPPEYMFEVNQNIYLPISGIKE